MKRAILLLLPYLQLGAGETILGAYIFHRHGDRTSKSSPPVLLTSEGVDQSRSSGAWYRNRYVGDNATSKIHGISSNIVDLSQVSVTSPADNVLQNSAQAFLQGLYPPVSNKSLEQSAGGDATLDGYQFIPVNIDGSSANSVSAEENIQLQSGSACPNAIASAQRYLKSPDYLAKLHDTRDFYQSLLPVYGDTFPRDEASFERAYAIYDLVHVSTLHIDTSKISHPELLTAEAQTQLYTLASAHEWGLAYDGDELIRAVAGYILAGQILRELNATLHTPLGTTSTNRLTIQFGPYATFMSFFGLSQATAASEDFYGIVDYASSFVVELVTDVEVPASSTDKSAVSPEDAYIRFLFANGAASDDNPPKPYPLFGQTETKIEWNTFADEMSEISLAETADWCVACRATEGICSTINQNVGGGCDPNVIVGVESGAVTLVVIAALAIVVFWFANLRVVKKGAIQFPRAARPKTGSYHERV